MKSILGNRWVHVALAVIAGAYIYSKTGVLDWLPGLKPAA